MNNEKSTTGSTKIESTPKQNRKITEHDNCTRCYIDAVWNSTTMSCGMGWIFRTNTNALLGDYTDNRRSLGP